MIEQPPTVLTSAALTGGRVSVGPRFRDGLLQSVADNYFNQRVDVP